MPKHKVVLLDVDGVLILPPKQFSQLYCEKYGIDYKKQQQFYYTQEFKDATTGKLDLLDAIVQHQDLWEWYGDPRQLLNMWFEAENYPNNALLTVVAKLQANGIPVFLTTQQEKYRAEYLKQAVFKELFDGMFVTCEIGYEKHEVEFWKTVLAQIKDTYPSVKPSEVAYFDDRQSLIDLARGFDIDAHLYHDVSQVRSVLRP